MTTAILDSAPAQSRPGRTDDLLATLAERIGARAGASNVFGTPVERGDVTVIPVASVRFGFGGGAGSDPEGRQSGEGGGGGGLSAAVGYIELKGDRSRFVPIIHPARMLLLVAGTLLGALFIIRR